jgi:hypothetical protein
METIKTETDALQTANWKWVFLANHQQLEEFREQMFVAQLVVTDFS